MEILATLGVNSTVFIQFAIFALVYLFLNNLVFKPYFAAWNERQSKTVGNTEYAERLIEESSRLQSEYETKARQLNQASKNIFDESRSLALKEYDQLVNSAREQAKVQLNQAKEKIQIEIKKTEASLQSEIPGVAEAIEGKLLGIQKGVSPT